MERVELELSVIRSAIEQKASVDLQFEMVDRDAAHKTVSAYANMLGRTFEHMESEDGQYKWFQIVNHSTDNVAISVFYDVPLIQ